MPHAVACWDDDRPVLDVDALGQNEHLTEWLLLGPFPMEDAREFTRDLGIGRADTIDFDPLGTERTVRPRAGMQHANPALAQGQSRWEKISGDAAYDLRDRFPGHGAAIAYAVTYFHAERPADLLLLASNWDDYRHCIVQLFLDGVEIGIGGKPAHASIAPGEHLLMAKIIGGTGGRSTWRLSVRAGRAIDIGAGLCGGLVAPSGFWRGSPSAPRVEIDAAVFNSTRGSLALDALTARIAGGEDGPTCEPRTLHAGEVTLVRVNTLIDTGLAGSETTVEFGVGDNRIEALVTVPELPPAGTLHVLEGFHCDPVWVSDQHHYNLVSLENVRQLLDGCIANPAYQCFLHEIDYLKPFIDEYPDYRAVLFGLVQRGQVSLGSSYNEPNENNCSGEAIIRNILYGHGFHRHFLGGNPLVYHAWDVFGHVPQLSQILAKSGLIGVVWSKNIYGLPPVFRHLSPDGTSSVHVRTPYGWGTHGIDRLRESATPLLAEKKSYGIDRHMVVDSGDFTSPSSWMVSRTAEMADSFPRIVMSSPEAFIQGIADDGARLPITSRNPSQYHIGTQHSRSEMKVANRLGENLLYAAEVWSTFASLMGAEYPDLALDKAWRQILFGEHHDALTGTPCDVSYLDLMLGYREALELANEAVAGATRFIAAGVERSEDDRDIVVFNAQNWARGGIVEIDLPEDVAAVEVTDAQGEAVPCEIADGTARVLLDGVPGVGYTTLSLREASPAPSAVIDTTPVLENEFWRIELDPARGGGIARLIDRETGRDVIDSSVGLGNDLAALRERGERHEASWEFWTTGERCFASDSPAQVSVTRSPIGQTATITGRIGEVVSYRRTLTLRPGQRTIEASVDLEGYAGQDDLFAVTTPAGLKGALPVFEDRFCSVVARRGHRKLDYRTGGPNKPSQCAVFPVYNWVEAGWSARIDVGNVSSLNLGMAGIVLPRRSEVGEGVVDDVLTPLLAALNGVGITATPYFEDDDADRVSELRERYPGALWQDTMLPRRDDVQMNAEWIAVSVAGNSAYVEELLDLIPDEARGRLQRDEAERGWGIVIAQDDRMPDEWPAMPVVILSARDLAGAASAVAHIGEQLARNGRIELSEGCDFRPEADTIDDYGLAMLTRGTGAASMEPDGTMVLFLTHTSDWSESHLPKHLVPEHRDMRFHYAFLPHSGSWRESDVVHAGYEFANPLIAAQAKGEGGPLPREDRFVAYDSPSSVITAIKPAGNPVSRFESAPSDPAAGIIMRAYESSGLESQGRIKLNRPVLSASMTSLMEEDRGEIATDDCCVDLPLGPFSVETVRIVPARETWPSLGSGALARATEQVQPVWCRYWKHNAGAHPMGYMPVGIYLDGELPHENEGGNFPTVSRLRVSIVNNLTDSGVSGSAEIVVPDRWTAIPASIPYDLAPREHVVRDVTITFDRPAHTGLVKARMTYAGQAYQDVVEAGRRTEILIGGGGGERLNRMDIVKEREPEWAILRDGDDVVVRVTNPWLEPLDAELAIVTPPEMWGSDFGDSGLAEVSPRTVGLNIPPRQTATAVFGVNHGTGRAPTFWAWAKLMHHGKADYRPVPGTTA